MNPDDYDSPRKRKKLKVKESVIDHTYRDYSQVEVPADEDEVDGSRPVQPNFPAKLHDIVSNPEYRHIIAWQPHGRCWKVIDKYLLSTVICPKYFSHSKFESFNRSVNGWGFKVSVNWSGNHCWKRRFTCVLSVSNNSQCFLCSFSIYPTITALVESRTRL